ncbi:SusC/RagA family TonB-linked outer membrane protein [Pseudopedobacter beijingensis]|uniref:SusC/RagA family TonB-linked outer membrane protein n=1 Tax=Pseudopedobacter beijingensis TaxID=1207056 RepID=A0ABW4IGL1_9SPHI
MRKNLYCYPLYGVAARLLLSVFFLLIATFVYSKQSIYSFNWDKIPAKNVFKQIETKANVKFAYNPLELDIDKQLTLNLKDKSLDQIIDAIADQLKAKYEIKGSVIIIQPNNIILNDKKKQLESGTLRGKVTDKEGVPLVGVMIVNSTTNKAAITDRNGMFNMTAVIGDILKFKLIGFEEKEYKVGNLSMLVDIKLNEATIQLETTVVTALGITREERSLGYAVSEVDGEGLKKARETNVINSLAGQVAGLVINSTAGGPAGSSRVIIRGNTTITGNNQPLYVIDGIPMDNSNYGGTGTGQYAEGYDMGDAISAINPDDIDKISVLKGPSASALYGTRAANGVILITTKKGKGSKTLGIEINSTSSFEDQLTKFDGYQYLYGQGTAQSINTAATQARTTLFRNFGARLDPDLQVIGYDGVYRPYALVKDNISGFFRVGSTYTNTIALTNSNDASSFRFSATDMRNRDIVPGSGMRRNSFSFNGTSKFGSKLTMEARAFYMNENVDNRPALADDPGNIGNAFVGLANNVNQEQFKDSYKNPDGSYIEWGGGQYRLNPYWVINEMRNETLKNRLMGSFQLNYTVNSWLSLQGRASTDLTFLDFEKYSPRTTPGFISGALSTRDRKHVTTEADFLMTLQKQISPSWHLSARLGSSISRVHNKGNTMLFTNLFVDDAIAPTSFADKSIVKDLYRRHLNSVYGLFSAGFKGYLYIDATVRQDASSTLPEDNNSYTYPSLSTSFVFSDAFKIGRKILSFGKLRVSAAEVAGDTDPFLLDLYYNVNPLTFNSTYLYGGASTDVMPNRNLKPTRTRSFEVGTELKFLDGRLGIDATYYTQKSRDQINRVPLPSSSGFLSQNINAGVVSNKGVELMIKGSPVTGRNFNWDANINFARNINTVESLAEGVPFLALSEARWMGVSVVAQPGAAYGSILAFDYQKDPDGNIILDPVTLLPMQSEERQIVGKGIFSWTGGITNNFTYKNFSLRAIIDIKQGADLFSMTNLFAASRGSLTTTLEGREEWIKSEEARQAAGLTFEEWNATGNVRGLVPKGVIKNEDGTYSPNTRAVDPSIYWAQIVQDGGVARPYIYDGSYVKMREITLGYRIPTSITSKWHVKDVQIALVSRNPFIIYKDVPNVDPDSNYNNGNGQGLEYGSLPTRRSWGFNLNFRF